MAFKMKGFPMHNTSALKNIGKGYYKEENPSAAFQQGMEPDPPSDPNVPREDWEPAWQGSDYSWEDIDNMSPEELKSTFPNDEWKEVQTDLAEWKSSQIKGKEEEMEDIPERPLTK